MATIVFVGYETTKGKSTNNNLTNLNPTQLVETYYKSIASRNYSKAEACLSDDIAKQYKKSPGSDFRNIKKLTDLMVSKAVNIKLYGKNYREVQVTAEYIVDYKNVITSENGKQIRFIYVAMKEKNSPWKIISIGTGP